MADPQLEMFPEIPRARPRLDEFIEEKYPVLAALEIPFGKFSGFVVPFVRVEFMPDATVFQAGGHEHWGQITDQNQDWIDNAIPWSVNPKRGSHEEGFASSATTPQGMSTPLLHIICHITDVDASSVGVQLDEIARVYKWHENVAEFMAMYQNAQVDESTSFYNRTKGYSVVFSAQELEVMKDLMPDPELIYEHPDAPEPTPPSGL